MPITKIMKGQPSDILAAEGLMYHDLCLTPCQRECCNRLGVTIQQEQEAYLTKHPEVIAMMELFVNNMTQTVKRKDILKEAGEYFTKPAEELDRDIRKRLGVPETGPYVKADKPINNYEDENLYKDLKDIIQSHYPPTPWPVPTPYVSAANTPSSSFLSIVTSDTTVPTPEPIPTPDPTFSETCFAMISNTVDKAIYSRVDDLALRYDTAYVELLKCIEDAMEVPVIEIKEDIAQLFYNSYRQFEINIIEKETMAAELAWERRMRKKLKRTLRRVHRFRGYETPPTPKSVPSSHESYKKPPPRPCICAPQIHYNRYDKDRFGIYMPLKTQYEDGNITVTPAISLEALADETTEEKADTKSILSKKSASSKKSNVSKKTQF